MQELERLTTRLHNIQAVEPILSALRTISSGSRLRALAQARHVQRYRQELMEALAAVLSGLDPAGLVSDVGPASGRLVVLVIGSERGLCGAFNDVLVEKVDQVLSEHLAAGQSVVLATLGTRMQRALRRRGYSPEQSWPLSTTALPPYDLAAELTTRWLAAYEAVEVDAVECIYNAYRSLTHYESVRLRLLPPELPPVPSVQEEWPPHVETDPFGLYVRSVELWVSAALYDILLESAAAEHTARYQLLDGAAQNAQRLLDELQLLLQAARQDAITAEMQDLTSGAGLLGPP
ncbi:MAG: hypothetical protein FJ026_10250 [Chloroflexi bacterium]|nr:hypothetical protein [Chloroflexota bacterium]